MQMTGSIRCCLSTGWAAADSAILIESDVFNIQWLLVDAGEGRRNPIRILPWFSDAAHQRCDIGAIRRARQPLIDVSPPFLLRHRMSLRRDSYTGQRPDGAVEGLLRQGQSE